LGEHAIVFHRVDPPEVPAFIIGKPASFVMISSGKIRSFGVSHDQQANKIDKA
jgi:hypothetical protein